MLEFTVRFHDPRNPQHGAIAEMTTGGSVVVASVEVDYAGSQAKTIEAGMRTFLALRMDGPFERNPKDD